MKILILSHAQYITVALPKIIEFAESLVRLGNNITLVVTHKENWLSISRLSKNGVNYILSPSLSIGNYRHGADIFDTLTRIRILKFMKFDIIHCIDSRPTVIFPGLFLKKSTKIPLVLEWSDLFGDGGTINDRSGTIYRHTLRYFESFFETAFRKYADGAVAISTLLKNKLIEMGYSKNKILIHRMGFNGKNFQNLNLLEDRKILNISRDLIIFSYFGRIHPQDHDLLIKSFEKFATQVNGKVCLFLIGDIKKKLTNNPKVVYKGYVSRDKYFKYLSATDVCLLPLKSSRGNMARWPSKFVDYLAAGKPVVSTPVSDLTDIFTNKIGVLSNNDTVQSYTKALLKMYMNKNQWNEMTRNSRHYAYSNFEWDLISKKIVDFYKNIITSKNR